MVSLCSLMNQVIFFQIVKPEVICSPTWGPAHRKLWHKWERLRKRLEKNAWNISSWKPLWAYVAVKSAQKPEWGVSSQARPVLNPAPIRQKSGCCCFEEMSFLNILHVEFVWLQVKSNDKTSPDIQSESESYILSLEGYINWKTKNTAAPFIWQTCLQTQCALSYTIMMHLNIYSEYCIHTFPINGI